MERTRICYDGDNSRMKEDRNKNSNTLEMNLCHLIFC